MIILSVLLILVILLQPGKGDMLTGGLGGIGGTFTSMFGSRRAMDLLMKITMGLAAAIFFLSLITNLFFIGVEETIVKPPTEGLEIPVQQQPQVPIQPSVPAPNK
jgi:protein translocase SecG subunit